MLSPQVQASIKKKMEKQKRRSSTAGAAGDIQTAPPPRHQKTSFPTAAAAEDSETQDEELDELMEGPQGRGGEREEEGEPVDLLPIVDSVFGQVGAIACRQCVCDSSVHLFVSMCVFHVKHQFKCIP